MDKANSPVCEDEDEDDKKHECVHDIDCDGKMKCCFQGCGGVCVMPGNVQPSYVLFFLRLA